MNKGRLRLPASWMATDPPGMELRDPLEPTLANAGCPLCRRWRGCSGCRRLVELVEGWRREEQRMSESYWKGHQAWQAVCEENMALQRQLRRQQERTRRVVRVARSLA